MVSKNSNVEGYGSFVGAYSARQGFAERNLDSFLSPEGPCHRLSTYLEIMLDGFEILSTSGVVLWSKSYAPVSSSIINGFIKDVFIEEKVTPAAGLTDDASATKNPTYKKDQYTLRWTNVKDLGLIFVVRMHKTGAMVVYYC